MEPVKLRIRNWVDENGNPAGGSVVGMGLSIQWQDGPCGLVNGKLVDPTGVFVEDVIIAAMARLRFYQEGKFPCSENDEALVHLSLALSALEARTARRTAAGIEGTHVETA